MPMLVGGNVNDLLEMCRTRLALDPLDMLQPRTPTQHVVASRVHTRLTAAQMMCCKRACSAYSSWQGTWSFASAAVMMPGEYIVVTTPSQGVLSPMAEASVGTAKMHVEGHTFIASVYGVRAPLTGHLFLQSDPTTCARMRWR